MGDSDVYHLYMDMINSDIDQASPPKLSHSPDKRRKKGNLATFLFTPMLCFHFTGCDEM